MELTDQHCFPSGDHRHRNPPLSPNVEQRGDDITINAASRGSGRSSYGLRGSRSALALGLSSRRMELLWKFICSWWVPLLAMAGVAILGVLAARKRRSEQPAEMELARESFFLAAGVCFMAFTNFFICVGARHVRLNDYNDRYLCLTHVFLDMTMYLSAAGVALWLLRRRPSARWLPAALALLTLAVTFFCLPAPARNPQYDQLRVFAAAVAKPGPSVLLGEYWSLYPLAALSPPDALIPVSPEDEAGPRTPFNVPFLTQANEVRVLHGGSRFLDSAGRPIQRLSQYGVSLEFVGPASSQETSGLVSLYRNQGKNP